MPQHDDMTVIAIVAELPDETQDTPLPDVAEPPTMTAAGNVFVATG
jgi:hypothetical protein